jgi:hypothetical protein
MRTGSSRRELDKILFTGQKPLELLSQLPGRLEALRRRFIQALETRGRVVSDASILSKAYSRSVDPAKLRLGDPC